MPGGPTVYSWPWHSYVPKAVRSVNMNDVNPYRSVRRDVGGKQVDCHNTRLVSKSCVACTKTTLTAPMVGAGLRARGRSYQQGIGERDVVIEGGMGLG